MDVVLNGQVTAILPVQQGVSQKSGQPWMSQEYVLCHEPGQYPRSICFRIFGEDKIKQMNIQMGEYISVHLNIDARQGQKGYFNTVDCWKVERAGQQMQQGYQPQYAPQQVYQQMPQQAAPFPPQVNAQGQPVQAPFPPQQPAAQPQQGGLPFPPAQ